MGAFRLTATVDADRGTLVLVGEVDLASAGTILELGRSVLQDVSVPALQLDLGQVTFIDSTGIGALIGLRNTAVALGKRVLLTAVPARVERVFQLAGLLAVFDIEPPR